MDSNNIVNCVGIFNVSVAMNNSFDKLECVLCIVPGL
jgi:hypothetical protein